MRKTQSLEQTVVLIKPDAVDRQLVGTIITRFEKAGLSLARLNSVRWSKASAMSFYHVHRGKQFFEPLVNYLSGKPSVALLFEGRHAIRTATLLVGATDPREAKPGTIRGDFGISPQANLVYASDSPQSARHDIALLFAKPSTSVPGKKRLVDQRTYTAGLLRRLNRIPPGKAHWRHYEGLMAEVCTILFDDALELPIPQAPPRSSSRRFDLVLYNSSRTGFWAEMKQQHSANPVLFEFKNKTTLDAKDIDQVSGYLAELGTTFGVVTSRESQNPGFFSHLSARYRSSKHIVLPLDDSLIVQLLKRPRQKDRILRTVYLRCLFRKDATSPS